MGVLEVIIDDEFTGNWDPRKISDDNTVRDRNWYVITYAGCAIYWENQL